MTIATAWAAEQTHLPSTCVVVDDAVALAKGVDRVRVASADALVREIVTLLSRNNKPSSEDPLLRATSKFYYRDSRIPPITIGLRDGASVHTLKAAFSDQATGAVTLLPDGKLDSAVGVDGAELARHIVFAFIPDVSEVERDPDIYADSLRLETHPATGAPLDLAWHATWEAVGPLLCLHTPDTPPEEVARIPYRAAVSTEQMIDLLPTVLAVPKTICTAFVRLGNRTGHAVSLRQAVDGYVVYHDTAPGGTLLDGEPAGEDTWRISDARLRTGLYTLFVTPQSIAAAQGVPSQRSLDEVVASDHVRMFNLREVSRSPVGPELSGPGSEVIVEPGGFRDKVKIRFAVDEQDRLDAALLSVDRSWADSPERPFAWDILRSMLAAAASPLDEPEIAPLYNVIGPGAFDVDGMADRLRSGPPHLLNQHQWMLTALLDSDCASALAFYQFTRVVLRNAGDWLHLGVEQTVRSAGPMLIGAQLPRPWQDLVH